MKTAREISEWVFDTGMDQIRANNVALGNMLGVATPDGVMFINVPFPVATDVVREQARRLSECDDVEALVWLGVVDLEEETQTVQPVADKPARADGLLLAVITRSERLMRCYALGEGGDSSTRLVGDERVIDTPVFLSWVFDGLWEVAQ